MVSNYLFKFKHFLCLFFSKFQSNYHLKNNTNLNPKIKNKAGTERKYLKFFEIRGICPGWSHQPGLKTPCAPTLVLLKILEYTSGLVAPTGTYAPLVPVGATNRH